MRNVDKIAFPYRAATHLNLLHVIAESGAWARQALGRSQRFTREAMVRQLAGVYAELTGR